MGRANSSEATSHQTPSTDQLVSNDHEDDAPSAVESVISTAIPRNPSDAWQCLKDVASSGPGDAKAGPCLRVPDPSQAVSPTNYPVMSASTKGTSGGIATYRLVREGYLTASIVSTLVASFAEHYHPYLPLVPRRYFDESALDSFAANDKHLLTAVLTIASKDCFQDPNVHMCCSRYMHDLISGVAAGHDCEVEAVEALLLLAEWEPQGLRHQIESVGRGEEDRAAWMHVGMALRTGYFLGLDRTAFRGDAREEASTNGRKRLAWASCYVSDRLISVRIGKAFWSRGPGPMTGLSSRDFPSLQPLHNGDEDYARVFQATLALTQLYSNVHDVLYSGMRTSGQMMLMGDYVKYVDEFRSAIAHWHRIWGNLECSQHIKVTLQMSYDYLRLYTNAFAFQAAISQSISRRPKNDMSSLPSLLRDVFSDIGSMPDARFIYESVAAAKSYLTTLSTNVSPEKHLRYMPLRFYLYAIYSAVFLYKARSYGVMAVAEEQSVRELVQQTMDVLRRASVSMQDPGSRYAQLLDLLWHKSRSGTVVSEPSTRAGSASYPSGSNFATTPAFTTVDQSGNCVQYSPANCFSWLDLEAVGDYVSNEQLHGGPDTSLFAPLAAYTTTPLSGQAAPMLSNGHQAWPQPGPYQWQVDLNGNLLF